jgi:pimeloyl-ACP methyl ester carboxylesterase
MQLAASTVQAEAHHIHVNGIDIHYVEAGEGEPLILLHGGVVSTNLIWEGVPMANASHMGHCPSASGSSLRTPAAAAGPRTVAAIRRMASWPTTLWD